MSKVKVKWSFPGRLFFENTGKNFKVNLVLVLVIQRSLLRTSILCDVTNPRKCLVTALFYNLQIPNLQIYIRKICDAFYNGGKVKEKKINHRASIIAARLSLCFKTSTISLTLCQSDYWKCYSALIGGGFFGAKDESMVPSKEIRIILKPHHSLTNRLFVHMRPANPSTGTTSFWNCSLEWFCWVRRTCSFV